MALLRRFLLVLTALIAATAGHGQDASPGYPAAPPGGILTLDPERLYQDTRFGRTIRAELDRLRAGLQAENGRLDRELGEEEAQLAARRPNMDPDEFHALADAFDEKAEAIRATQAGKLQGLIRRREDEKQRFFSAVLPVIADVVRERRGVIIFERRMVFLAADSIDITDQLIRRIDALTTEAGVLLIPVPPADEGESRPSDP